MKIHLGYVSHYHLHHSFSNIHLAENAIFLDFSVTVTEKMANSTAGQCAFPSTIQFWFSVAIIGAFLLFALFVQSFIVAVNFIDWLKGRSLTTTDQLITSIGITRIIYHFTVPMHFLSYSCSGGLGTTFLISNLFTGISAGFSGFWLSALLSTFFCLQISTFNKVFFLNLKTFISQRLICLIISSVLLGYGYALTIVVLISFGVYQNISLSKIIHDNHDNAVIFSLNCLLNIMPVLLFFVSSVLLAICLGFHIRQMRNHRTAMSSTDTYHKMIIFTALSFLTCAFCGIVNVTEEYSTKLIGIMSMYILWNIFPLLHSVSLIYVIAKLRNECVRMVNCGMDCLFWRKSSVPDSREPMEMIVFD